MKSGAVGSAERERGDSACAQAAAEPSWAMIEDFVAPGEPQEPPNEQKRLQDMSPVELNEALGAISSSARQVLGRRVSRVWVAEAFEVEGVACSLEVELSARCESLDDPGMPSGWRFRLESSCQARLAVDGRGAVFSSESGFRNVGSDPHGDMSCSRGASLVNDAMDKALFRLRHSQAFTTWREAAAIDAGLQSSSESEPGPGAKRL